MVCHIQLHLWIRCDALLEAARFPNFRSAAKAVALTPAALGQRIRQLEEMMGHQLFHRTHLDGDAYGARTCAFAPMLSTLWRRLKNVFGPDAVNWPRLLLKSFWERDMSLG